MNNEKNFSSMKASNQPDKQPMIKIRGGYSERSGEIRFEEAMQVDDFNGRTRTVLSNCLFTIVKYAFEEEKDHFYPQGSCQLDQNFCKVILSDVFGESTRLPRGYAYDWEDVYERIDKVIMRAPYNEVLDIIEYVLNWLEGNSRWFPKDIYTLLDQLFERESVGYRFADGKIIPITDENEICEIKSACNGPYESCRNHIRKAVQLFSDRESKDYKNSIKESISAVEAVCKIITENEKATLGQAIKKLEDGGVKIHPSLEAAFSNLYGYTNDEGGIRHGGGLFESNVSFDEAKYMLVTCSAFLNYLIAEYEKI